MKQSQETYVVLPGNVVERNRVDVLVEDERARDDKVENIETLGTEVEGQNFDRVCNNERSECKTVRCG